jgi:hypothetical protein
MAKSRSRYVITYLGCPLIWASRLQTVFALSTSEAEYIALSTALRDVIPMMDLLNEMKETGHDVQSRPMVHCKLFEDNSGALEFARVLDAARNEEAVVTSYGIGRVASSAPSVQPFFSSPVGQVQRQSHVLSSIRGALPTSCDTTISRAPTSHATHQCCVASFPFLCGR